MNTTGTSVGDAPSWPCSLRQATTKQTQYSYFSSMAPMKHENDDDDEGNNVLVIPSNLKFDPKAISTPIYGLDKIEEEEDTAVAADVDNVDENEDNKILDGSQTVEGQEVDSEDYSDLEEYNDVDEDDEEDDDNSPALYSLPNNRDDQRIQYAIPLPDRLHVPIIDFKSNTNVGSIHLSPHVFGNDPIRVDILHRVVVYQRNKKRGRRNGGARTKTISEVSGSGKKMRNQKGGGVARAGHKRPPHWRGGAKAHGPKGSVQNYETKLNKKVRKMGVRMALSQKLKEGNLILVNSFEELGTHKTKVLLSALEDLGDIGGKYGCTAYIIDHFLEDEEQENEDWTLRSIDGVDINMHVASGNLHKVKVRNQQFLNVYDILKYEKLVLTLSALEALEKRYAD